MDNENAPETFNQAPKSGKGKNVIIGLLAAAVIGLSGFFIYDHGKSTEQIQAGQTEVAKITTEKSEIQSNFDASLARLDSLTTMNTDMREKLAGRDAEIKKIKSEIRTILNKRNATAAELAKARNLIAQLNGQITDLQEQIAALQTENANLKEQNAGLTAEKETLTRNLDSTKVVNTGLTEKVDVASTLNASNITITPVKVKKNGKEKVRTKAKAVDKLLVSFDVSNRIISSGTTDVYVVVIGPDGKAVTSTPGSGTFNTRDSGEMPFTAKLPVTLETSKVKNVEFGFAPGDHFVQGAYKIQIYQNGFLIGEGTRQLKKGGIFG
jgi:predicted  nucleic acid-binding Zn-ribbon protein